MTREEKINLMIDYLHRFIGTPYHYGGKVPQDGGIDCSGLIVEGLRAVGDWGSQIANAQMLHDSLVKKGGQSVADIQKGDLIFFGTDKTKISHVAVATGKETMLEAGGTDQNGMVRLRPLTWRRDRINVIRLI